MTRTASGRCAAFAAAAACALPAPARADALDSGDTAWLLTASALVLFMTLPGLALFYAGLVRGKNALSIVMQCFAITALVSLLWVACGYSLVFAPGGPWPDLIGSLDASWLNGVTRSSVRGSVPEGVFVLFQMTFAIITPTLVIGAFAERLRFAAVLLFTAAWLLLVYVPVAHWVWGGGWLARIGVMDFAGGIVVHVTAGVAALVAALVVGRRRGFPHVSMPPHSLPLTAAGAGMLWVGWFGFNGGSALAAGGSAGMAILATHLAAAAGALAWMLIEWWRFEKPSTLGILTGMVAGLGTITPASGFIAPGAAISLGALAGAVCFLATQWFKRGLHIDDSLDVSSVHGVGGVLGSILTGALAAPLFGGVGFTVPHGIGAQLGVQALGVGVTIAWCGTVTWLLLKAIDALLGLRVSDEAETEGLDLAAHGERGYTG